MGDNSDSREGYSDKVIIIIESVVNLSVLIGSKKQLLQNSLVSNSDVPDRCGIVPILE